MKMKKILMLACTVLMVSVAAAQKKPAAAPAKPAAKAATEQKTPAATFAKMADQALAKNLITKEERDSLVVINKNANDQKSAVNKSNMGDDEKKAALKKIDKARVDANKALLGAKYADFAAFIQQAKQQ